MLRKLKWKILAARYNWCQGPVPGRGPAVDKHWSRSCTAGSRSVWRSRHLNVKRFQTVLWNTTVRQRVEVPPPFPSTWVFPRRYHSAKTPHSFIYHPVEGKWSRHNTQLCRRFLSTSDKKKDETEIEYSLIRTTYENKGTKRSRDQESWLKFKRFWLTFMRRPVRF
jgi:hypothetical protein